MRTLFRTDPEIEASFLELADAKPPFNSKRPETFIQIMKTNQGSCGVLTRFGLDEEGLERKNPVIVALGDSVTAGHFEWLITMEKLREISQGQIDPADFAALATSPLEVTDARESYIEKFRLKLIDHFELTSVSVINAGIAGDNIFGMNKRLSRDVIRYQPDLVLINGSLNWNESLGDASVFKRELRQVIQTIKANTIADIILLTPNVSLGHLLSGKTETLPERVATIRELASEEDVCLADTYAIWEDFIAQGNPVEAILANGINHPSITGHEVYARCLMKLIV